jgi:hypothetical protein
MMPSAPASRMRCTSPMPGTRTNGVMPASSAAMQIWLGAFERKARMLHVDIEAVEARGLGDARDLDAVHKPHGHRGDDLVAGELFLHVIAQNVADLDRLFGLT